MSKSVIDPKKSYTFSDYFKLNPPIDKLLTYFGYQHQMKGYVLPQTEFEMESMPQLKDDLMDNLHYIHLTSNAARRVALIGPTILALAKHLQLRIDMDYPLKVSKQLQGELDYLLRQQGNLVVVEARKENLYSGFIQLAVQLIALDDWLEESTLPIYGAVTIGYIWQFGILDRTTKLITQDTNLYRVPADLEELLGILIAILEGKESNGNIAK